MRIVGPAPPRATRMDLSAPVPLLRDSMIDPDPDSPFHLGAHNLALLVAAIFHAEEGPGAAHDPPAAVPAQTAAGGAGAGAPAQVWSACEDDAPLDSSGDVSMGMDMSTDASGDQSTLGAPPADPPTAAEDEGEGENGDGGVGGGGDGDGDGVDARRDARAKSVCVDEQVWRDPAMALVLGGGGAQSARGLSGAASQSRGGRFTNPAATAATSAVLSRGATGWVRRSVGDVIAARITMLSARGVKSAAPPGSAGQARGMGAAGPGPRTTAESAARTPSRSKSSDLSEKDSHTLVSLLCDLEGVPDGERSGVRGPSDLPHLSKASRAVIDTLRAVRGVDDLHDLYSFAFSQIPAASDRTGTGLFDAESAVGLFVRAQAVSHEATLMGALAAVYEELGPYLAGEPRDRVGDAAAPAPGPSSSASSSSRAFGRRHHLRHEQQRQEQEQEQRSPMQNQGRGGTGAQALSKPQLDAGAAMSSGGAAGSGSVATPCSFAVSSNAGGVSNSGGARGAPRTIGQSSMPSSRSDRSSAAKSARAVDSRGSIGDGGVLSATPLRLRVVAKGTSESSLSEVGDTAGDCGGGGGGDGGGGGEGGDEDGDGGRGCGEDGHAVDGRSRARGSCDVDDAGERERASTLAARDTKRWPWLRPPLAFTGDIAGGGSSLAASLAVIDAHRLNRGNGGARATSSHAGATAWSDSLLAGDATVTEDTLRRAFDTALGDAVGILWDAASLGLAHIPAWGVPRSRDPCARYAALSLAGAAHVLGAQAAAARLVGEALRAAQHRSDDPCLAHSLAWLAAIAASPEIGADPRQCESLLMQCASRARKLSLHSLSAHAYTSLARHALLHASDGTVNGAPIGGPVAPWIATCLSRAEESVRLAAASGASDAAELASELRIVRAHACAASGSRALAMDAVRLQIRECREEHVTSHLASAAAHCLLARDAFEAHGDAEGARAVIQSAAGMCEPSDPRTRAARRALRVCALTLSCEDAIARASPHAALDAAARLTAMCPLSRGPADHVESLRLAALAAAAARDYERAFARADACVAACSRHGLTPLGLHGILARCEIALAAGLDAAAPLRDALDVVSLASRLGLRACEVKGTIVLCRIRVLLVPGDGDPSTTSACYASILSDIRAIMPEILSTAVLVDRAWACLVAAQCVLGGAEGGCVEEAESLLVEAREHAERASHVPIIREACYLLARVRSGLGDPSGRDEAAEAFLAAEAAVRGVV